MPAPRGIHHPSEAQAAYLAVQCQLVHSQRQRALGQVNQVAGRHAGCVALQNEGSSSHLGEGLLMRRPAS